MARNYKQSKLSLFLTLSSTAVLVLGVFVTTNLTKQKQNIRTKASNEDPLINVAETTCKCTGPAVCTKITEPLQCGSNKKCLWTCSDQSFQKPTLITPNGGEKWERTKTFTVSWEQAEASSSTGLFIYTRDKNVDKYYGAIAYHVSNQVGMNEYQWTIPLSGWPENTPPDGSNIILSVAQFDSNGNVVSWDKSDTTFTITTPKPTVISPNGGEVFERGRTYEITWDQEFVTAYTHLFIYTRDKKVDTYIGAIDYYVSNNLGRNTYSWTIPPEGGPITTPPDGSNIIIEVAQYRTADNRVTGDKSDQPFTITAP